MSVTNNKGYKVAKLICVTSVNNNKFYNMEQINENEFVAEWGRVESGKSESKTYPIKDWDKIYKDKTKESKKPKPYSDITYLYAEAKSNGNSSMFAAERPAIVVSFVEHMLKFAKESVEKNYVVSSNKVTKAQVDEAQGILDEISKLIVKDADVKGINDKLLELYKIIPRKMKKVQDHLLEGNTLSTKDSVKLAKELFSNEQDALDVMAGQVAMTINGDSDVGDDMQDILTKLNLDAFECSNAEIEMIKKKMGSNASQFVRAIRVRNMITETEFNKFLVNSKNKKTDLLWHGSRNENWWSIFQQGLKIRPSNAVHTGSMFGDGVYFADKAQKSIGYTSLSGSYWARGSSKSAILGLYEIHQGKQMEILHWKSEHSRLSESKLSKDGYDSVFAKGGADLRNNEYIVYNSAQSTIRYLIEIK